jgi:hypothetical protein
MKRRIEERQESEECDMKNTNGAARLDKARRNGLVDKGIKI